METLEYKKGVRELSGGAREGTYTSKRKVEEYYRGKKGRMEEGSERQDVKEGEWRGSY